MLYAGRDVHRLAEIIEAIVQRHRYRGPLVDADLEDQLPVRLAAVEPGDLRTHGQRRGDSIRRVQEGRHDGVADGLDDGAMAADGDVLQALEMALHQGEGVEIADAIVEGRGALEVGEQQGDFLDADALARLDYFQIGRASCRERV